MVNEAVIHLENIDRTYMVGNEIIHALRSVSLDISRNEYVALMGSSGSGKSTLASGLRQRLTANGYPSHVLDGDNVRRRLNRDLGFSPADRAENIRRISEVARLFNEAGLIAIAAFISPYRMDRASARAIIGPERFVEIWLTADVATCEGRDPKGLYAKARSGHIP